MTGPVQERRIHWTKDNAHLLAGYRDEPRVDFGAMIRAVRRQMLLVAAFAMIGFAIAVMMILGSVPKYTAVETVLLDEERAELLNEVSPLPNAVRSDTAVQSEMEIIRSGALAYQVVDLLQLDKDTDFLSPPVGLTEKVSKAISSVTRPLARLLTPEPPARANENTSVAGEAGPDDNAIPDFDLELTDRDRAVRILRDRLSVSRSGRSLVIEIAFADFDPTRAAQIARGYGSAYESFQLLTTNEVAAKAEEWLRERLEELEQKSIDAASALQEFRTENDLVQVRGDLLTEQQQSELASELMTAAAAAAEAEAYLESMESLSARAVDGDQIIAVPLVEGLAAGISEELRRDYLNARQRRQEIVSQFGADHPQVPQLNGSIQVLENALRIELQQATEAARVAYNIARGREQSLRSDLAAITGTTDWNVALRGRLQQLEAISETYAQVYRDYLARLEVTMQQQDFPIASVKIISPAEIPQAPSSPQKKAMLFAGLFLGGLLGALIGATRELIPKPVRTVSTLREEVGVNCAGLLPGPKSRIDAGAERAQSRTMERLAGTCETILQKSTGALIAVAPLSSGLKAEADLPLDLAERLSCDGSRKVLVIYQDALEQALPVSKSAAVEIASLQQVLETVLGSDQTLAQGADLMMLASELRGKFSFVLFALRPLSQATASDFLAEACDATLLRIQWGKALPSFISDALMDHPRFKEALITTVLEEANLAQARRYIGPGSYEELQINA